MKFFTPITARLLAVAIVVMTAQVTSLPTYGLHRHHGRNLHIHRRSPGDDHGDVSAHNGYEAQLHSLEAALHHYEEYGDAKSLETYLNGFTVDSSADTSKNEGASGNSAGSQGDDNNDKHVDAGKENEEQHQEQSDDCEEGDQTQQQQPSKDSSSSQQQQQPQQQPKMVKKPKKTQHQPSQDYTQPQEQPKPQPQPEQPKPQPQPSQPQTPPESYDPAPAPSKDKDDSNNHHHDDGNNASNKPSPAPPSSDSSSDSHSIDGYTCPKFETSSAPSTSSLYTSPKPFTGRATFYDTGLGACGIVNSDNDPIVAISRDLFEQYNPSDSNPNHNSLCGRKVEITWKGKTVHAFATDECPGCLPTSLDMSPKVFESLDAKEKGVLDGIQWRFV